jgi:uncharacterized membrane protein
VVTEGAELQLGQQWLLIAGVTITVAAISVLWTLYSIALILLGFQYWQARLRPVSLGLFGVTILKVFLADMARVNTPFRIVSFVMLGLRLIGASYLYYRYRGYLLPTPPAGEQL